MRLAIVGGTGLVGQYVKAAADARGHESVVIARSTGVDVRTGEGLKQVVAGAEAIVDVSNIISFRRQTMVDFFVSSAANLHAAAQDAGVAHLVVLSIVGMEGVSGYPYYHAKLAQERAALDGPTPVSIVRATQFHEFAGQLLQRMRTPLAAVVPSFPIQPVAARTVGNFLVVVAESGPAGPGCEVGGPETVSLVDVARRTQRLHDSRRVIVPFRVPGKIGRALRSGALLATPATTITGPGFSEWLTGGDAH